MPSISCFLVLTWVYVCALLNPPPLVPLASIVVILSLLPNLLNRPAQTLDCSLRHSLGEVDKLLRAFFKLHDILFDALQIISPLHAARERSAHKVLEINKPDMTFGSASTDMVCNATFVIGRV